VKKAIDTYRDKNREKYNEYCSQYLKRRLQDPDYADARRKKINEYNKAYQQQKRDEKKANGFVPRPRGRPKKIAEEDLGKTENCKVVFGDS
jgi:predicted PolB exonuclease-like 3'-5' exonuclease